MEILTKVTVTLEEYETPGITTHKSYADFWEKVFKNFISEKYIKSDACAIKDKVFLSQYIDSIKKEYDIIFNLEGSYGMLGGYFVWNLLIRKYFVIMKLLIDFFKKKNKWVISIFIISLHNFFFVLNIM